VKGTVWVDKGTTKANSFPLSSVSTLTVSPDFKTLTYKATAKLIGGTSIAGTISGTLTFNPAIDIEHARDQTAKTSKMILGLSIAKVNFDVKRVLTGGIDFTG
jgi:hypothetical protein